MCNRKWNANINTNNSGQSTIHEQSSNHGNLQHRDNSAGKYSGTHEKAVNNPVPGKGKGE